MSANDDIYNALLAINSRLSTIEGKINLMARAERSAIVGLIEEKFRADPILGQIYLVIDGSRNQKEVLERLMTFGIETSQPTVSRRMTDLVTEFGVADSVGSGKVLRQDRAAEEVLNLSGQVKSWLVKDKQVVPLAPPKKKPRKPKA